MHIILKIVKLKYWGSTKSGIHNTYGEDITPLTPISCGFSEVFTIIRIHMVKGTYCVCYVYTYKKKHTIYTNKKTMIIKLSKQYTHVHMYIKNCIADIALEYYR